MKPVRPFLSHARSMLASNSWLLTDSGGRRFLIDCGHPLERPALKAELARAGIRDKGDLDAVLLTHRHSDHAGNAAWLKERFGCPVICHEEDRPCLSGEVPPPRMPQGRGPFVYGLLNRIEDRFPARCAVDEVFTGGAWRWGFRIIHVPGHTEGSAMLFHEPTGTLFSGDAILSGLPVLRMVRLLRPAQDAFSHDVERCRENVREFLAEMPRVDILCSGHGPVVTDATTERLRRFYRDYWG